MLFLCTGNSARSVIAEALLKEMGGARFDVQSAGTHPKGLNPYTARALKAESISLAGFRSRSVDEFEGETFDYVITVCDSAAEECPIFPGETRRLHWSFPDPAAAIGSDSMRLAAFTRTVAGMRECIAEFIAALEKNPNPAGR